MKTLLKFYLSCLLASWGDRLWFFALSIYLVTINSNTLLVTAISGFSCNLASIILGGYVGSLIDKYQRINLIRVTLFIQNTTIAGCCILVVLIVVNKKSTEILWNGTLLYVLQGIVILLNVVSDLASQATKIAIERDWVIVIAKNIFKRETSATEAVNNNHKEKEEEEGGEGEWWENCEKFSEKLANINAVVRRIDLCTSIIAPLIAGLLMSFFHLSPTYNGIVMSAIFFAAWNLISYFFEYYLMLGIYNDVPELKKAIHPNNKPINASHKPFKELEKIFKGWPIYIKQGLIVMPGLALAILYLTVLTFDSITIGYAKSQRLTELAIGLFQGIGSISGVLGTIGFQILHNKLKIFLPVIGLIGSIYQLIFLFCCFASIWLPGSPFVLSKRFHKSNNMTDCEIRSNHLYNLNNTIDSSLLNETKPITFKSKEFLIPFSWKTYFFESKCEIYDSILLLLLAIALSRFGLWLLDLSIHQIIQEGVSEKKRGVIGGVQNSMNQLFELIKFSLVIILYDVANYGYLVIISVSAVFTALCLYSTFTIIEIKIRKKEKQLEIMVNMSSIKN